MGAASGSHGSAVLGGRCDHIPKQACPSHLEEPCARQVRTCCRAWRRRSVPAAAAVARLMRVAARAYDPGLPAAREHEQQRAPCGDARECPASRGVAAGAARPLPLRTIPVVAETKGALALPLVSAILVGLPSHPLHLGGMPLCNAPGCSALEPWLRRFQRPGLGEAGPRLRVMCRVHAWRSTRETASATRAGGEKLPAVAGHGFRLSHKVTHGVLGGGGVCRRGAAVQGLFRGGVSSVRGGGGQGDPHLQQRRLRDAGAVVFGLDDA